MEEYISEATFKELAEQAASKGKQSILLFEDIDGNWRGGMTKNGKFINVRQVGPETVMQLLLTHE